MEHEQVCGRDTDKDNIERKRLYLSALRQQMMEQDLELVLGVGLKRYSVGERERERERE